MNVILLRHGHTEGNLAKRYVGSRDEPLSALGRAEALAAGVFPEVSRVYVSPKKRALETAAICFPNARQIIYADLREMSFGDFEGRSAEDMSADPDYQAWLDSFCEAACPNGEGKQDFSTRVSRAFNALVAEAAQAGEETVILVAHGGTLMTIMQCFTQSDKSYYDWYPCNAQGWRVELNPMTWTQAPYFSFYERFAKIPL